MSGKVINDNNVEIKTSLEAKRALPSYFCANIAVVLAAGMADNKIHTFAGKVVTCNILKIIMITRGKTINL